MPCQKTQDMTSHPFTVQWSPFWEATLTRPPLLKGHFSDAKGVASEEGFHSIQTQSWPVIVLSIDVKRQPGSNKYQCFGSAQIVKSLSKHSIHKENVLLKCYHGGILWEAQKKVHCTLWDANPGSVRHLCTVVQYNFWYSYLQSWNLTACKISRVLKESLFEVFKFYCSQSHI